MKNIIILLMILGSGLVVPKSTRAQSTEVVQLLLNVEKLSQLEQILRDMKKGYEILSGGYNMVKDISEGNFSLHKAFLDGLWQVSPQVRKYRKVATIFDYQIRLIQQYKSAFNHFKKSNLLSVSELGYLQHVYDNLVEGSLKSLDELAMVLTAGQLRMSDKERLEAIDRIHSDMAARLSFLRGFNDETSVLLLQRKRAASDLESEKILSGVK